MGCGRHPGSWSSSRLLTGLESSVLLKSYSDFDGVINTEHCVMDQHRSFWVFPSWEVWCQSWTPSWRAHAAVASFLFHFSWGFWGSFDFCFEISSAVAGVAYWCKIWLNYAETYCWHPENSNTCCWSGISSNRSTADLACLSHFLTNQLISCSTPLTLTQPTALCLLMQLWTCSQISYLFAADRVSLNSGSFWPVSHFWTFSASPILFSSYHWNQMNSMKKTNSPFSLIWPFLTPLISISFRVSALCYFSNKCDKATPEICYRVIQLNFETISVAFFNAFSPIFHVTYL